MTEPFELISDAIGRLTLRRQGQDDVADVRVRRSFPWSHPSKFICIRSGEGKELLMIDDLQTLAAAQRELIEKFLADTSFIPRITRVQSVDVRFGYQQWKVQTDRGPAEFRVQEREDIRFLPDGRFRIKDADGNIYELPPISQLDPASRKAIDALV